MWTVPLTSQFREACRDMTRGPLYIMVGIGIVRRRICDGTSRLGGGGGGRSVMM